MTQTLTVGDRVTITANHNKGKSGTIHQIQETQACCWIEDTMYLWYPLEELQKARVDFNLLADELIAGKEVSPRFRAHLVEFLHEAYGVRASTLTPDLTCFVNAQANTYSYQSNSEVNNIAGNVELCPVRADKGKIREIVPECKHLNFADARVLLDSGAFPEVIANCRVTPEHSLKRQLWALENLPEFKEVLLVSYDRLIDEKHVNGKRVKQRWSVEEGKSAVRETVEAVKYLDSQRHALDGYTLVQSCQGVDAAQYLNCVEQVLEYCRPGDIVGLGGWCILGRQPSYLQTFWETINLVIPAIASCGINKIHIFGVTWYKPRKHQPLPPLQPLLWLCDQYGIQLSTDGRSPIANALWKDTTRAGAIFPYWRHNLAWVKAEFATFRDSPLYQVPPGYKLMVAALDNDSRSLPIPPDSQAQTPKESDKWYTPPKIVAAVNQVLESIALDPCADDGKHIPATTHYTASDDGLTKEWYGKVYMNPPYSCPGKWVAKLQEEVDAGRVVEAIALVPAATDTNWLHPYLANHPICLWKGRIKFLDTNYREKDTARQSHCLLYWGDNPQKFKEVFDLFGTVKNVGQESRVISQESLSPDTQYPIPNTMTIQFPQVEAIAAQIAQLQEQLAKYNQCQTNAETLLQSVVDQAGLMTELGVKQETIVDWGDKLYFMATGIDIRNIKQDSDLVAELEQLRQERDKTVSGLQESILDLSSKVEELRKEKNDADKTINQLQQDYDEACIKLGEMLTSSHEANLPSERTLRKVNENLVTDIENLKNELEKSESKNTRLTKRMELLDRDNRGFLERIQQLESQLKSAQEPAPPILGEQKQFTIGDRVATKVGGEGMVIGFVYENVMVELPNGRFNFRYSDLTKIDDETTEELESVADEVVEEESPTTTDLEVGDIVQREDGKVGTVTYIPSPFKGILSTKFPDGSFNNHAVNLKFISRPNKKDESEIIEATPIELADRVQLVNPGSDKDLTDFLHREGTVIEAGDNLITVVFDPTDRHESTQLMLSRDCLKLLSKQPDAACQMRAERFISGIKNQAHVKAIAWSDIAEVCQNNPLGLKEMAIFAKTKTQKQAFERIPTALAEYIKESGDRSPLDWVGDSFREKVENILGEAPF